MALRAGYKGFKKLLSPLKIIRPGIVTVDMDAVTDDIINDSSSATNKTWSASKLATVRNGVIANTELIKDTVGWSGKNLFSEIYEGIVILGNATHGYNLDNTINGYTCLAKVVKNTSYIVSKSQVGNRFRIVKFKTHPIIPSSTGDETAVEVVATPSLTEYIFDSGDFEYVAFTCNTTDAYTGNINAMIRDASILDPTYEPYFGSTAFPRSEQAVLGAGNFMPETVYTLGIASSLGTVTLATNAEAVTFSAPIKRNTHYYISKDKGNRFRLALSNTPPANGSTANLIYTNDEALSYEFDSGNYDYVILCTNIGSIDESTIHPLLALSKDTPYAPYAMTNRELTDEVATLIGSAADQKTAINAIITAATGAEDFAAFKTAIGAITPVTRSLSMTAAPEEIAKEVSIEEPIVEKKTTTRKKSTAKADTTEEV